MTGRSFIRRLTERKAVKYDFDQEIERCNSGCTKWDSVGAVFGSPDVLPMWIADMDFTVARPITDALRKRTEHEVYGYAAPSASLIDAVIQRMWKRYSWKVQPEWLVFTNGVVPALYTAIKAFTHPGDEVIVQGPVYYPFWSIIRGNGCIPADNQLKLANGQYEMDFADLQNQFLPRPGIRPVLNRVRMMILCNPHNPVGRVWTRDEITRAGEIVLKCGALMVSDEIHCELLYKGYRHTPFATISEEFAQNCIVCMAPSKTFNLAGLEASSIIIPNARLRNSFIAARIGIMPQPNIFGLVAMEAAYRDGDEWLEQVLEDIQGNMEYMTGCVAKRIPRIRVIRPQGTDLVWLDCRGLGMDAQTLHVFMRRQAKVGLEDGYLFGPSGAGFMRMNIACRRATLGEALQRIEQAVNNL